MQVRNFLERYPPYDSLPNTVLDRVVDGVEIAFFAAGDTILRTTGAPAQALFVVRTGAVELIDEDRLIDLLGEGESFGHASMLSGLSPTFEVRAHEDTICYLIDPEAARTTLATAPGLAFLAANLRRRTIRAVEAGRVGSPRSQLTPLGALVRRPAVTADRTTEVGEAAATMTRERISSLLVTGGRQLGIVTDRDLRTDVLAAGRSSATPIGEIASSPIVSAPADTSGEEAILLMFDLGIHHLPVTSPDGSVIGLVTDTDLIGLERADAFAFRGGIERAADPASVGAQLRALPEVVAGLVRIGVDPLHVGRVVAISTDIATRRSIELAIADMGDPPRSWAWLALGSQARHEQALRTDQDHGLVFEPGDGSPEEVDRYFEEIARRVADGLESGGIPRCRGGVMAENAAWRMTTDGWIRRTRRWMQEASTEGLAFTSIALDYRRIAGPSDVERAIDDVLREAPRHPGFVRGLGRTAIDLRPPTGFFRDLVVEAKGTHEGTLDVKAGGITPLTDLARAYGAAAGLTGNGTLVRIAGAVAEGRLDEELGNDLRDAFRLLWRVRLEHQVEQAAEGRGLDERVDPASLGTIVRGGLKEAFRTVARAQRDLARQLGLKRA